MCQVAIRKLFDHNKNNSRSQNKRMKRKITLKIHIVSTKSSLFNTIFRLKRDFIVCVTFFKIQIVKSYI